MSELDLDYEDESDEVVKDTVESEFGPESELENDLISELDIDYETESDDTSDDEDDSEE